MTEEKEEGQVVSLADALAAMSEEVRAKEDTGLGAPGLVVVLAAYTNGQFTSHVAGPGFSPEAHMKLLGAAGLEAARAMGVPVSQNLILPN